jgi:broad specificity phosphatase PhoE
VRTNSWPDLSAGDHLQPRHVPLSPLGIQQALQALAPVLRDQSVRLDVVAQSAARGQCVVAGLLVEAVRDVQRPDQ